eukprot:CAMPEP_0179412358 /NCGR_PEP_ID=MMETSP0799-20121207/4423_1 /TAXON_ID=46947 /ORGANISM="Geminigera cryophila, Strain CCMP2564" /LENGTH=295 /DNA_ID=CAMNT_0021184559 /DNA_START=203 /DNA_END=1090 /DNA_ORIENTATION=+
MPGQEVTDPLQHFMHDVRAGTSQSCLRDSSVSVREEEYDQDYSTEGSHECDGSEGSISAHASNNNSYHGDPKDLVPSEGSRASSPLSHEEAEGNAKEANYENMRRVAPTLTQGDCEKLLEYQAQQRREKRRTLRREALEILMLEERCSARRSARRKERDEASGERAAARMQEERAKREEKRTPLQRLVRAAGARVKTFDSVAPDISQILHNHSLEELQPSAQRALGAALGSLYQQQHPFLEDYGAPLCVAEIISAFDMDLNEKIVFRDEGRTLAICRENAHKCAATASPPCARSR